MEENQNTTTSTGIGGESVLSNVSITNSANTTLSNADVVYNDAQKEALEFIEKYKGYDDQGYVYQDAMLGLDSDVAKYVEEYNTGDASWVETGDPTLKSNANSTPGVSTTSSMLNQSSVTKGIDFYSSVYSYAGDSDNLDELCLYLEQSAHEIDSLIRDIFAKIDELSTVWDGEAYTEFVNNCKSYSEALNGLVALLMAFSKEFNILYIDNDALIDYVESQIRAISSVSVYTSGGSN